MDFKKYLTEDVLPFWLHNAIDEEKGGIFTQLAKDGTVYGTEKSVWFQGRALWVFSKAYNHIEKRKEYLDAAKKIYDFIPLCEDTDGRMFFTVTREGKGIQKRRYYYSETFAAIACAQYFKATGEKEAWERAERYFAIAKRCFDDPTQNPPKFTTAAKALAPVMIMMNTARCMAECAPEPEAYAALAGSYAEEIIRGGYFSEEVGALLESVSPDGRFVDTPAGRVVNPGHSLEAAWFLLVEGVLGKNDEALVLGKRIIDVTMPLGLDKKHGGIIAFTDAKGLPPSALEWDMKIPLCYLTRVAIETRALFQRVILFQKTLLASASLITSGLSVIIPNMKGASSTATTPREKVTPITSAVPILTRLLTLSSFFAPKF